MEWGVKCEGIDCQRGQVGNHGNHSRVEGRTDQRNAQINFSLINLLLFKLLRYVSAT